MAAPRSALDLVKTAGPVDPDDPNAICHRLAELEDAIAVISGELARTALRIQEADRAYAVWQRNLWPSTAAEGKTVTDRTQALHRMMAADAESHAALTEMQAARAAQKYGRELMDGCESRRSICQTLLKPHLNEQQPKFGQGAGRTDHLREAS